MHVATTSLLLLLLLQPDLLQVALHVLNGEAFHLHVLKHRLQSTRAPRACVCQMRRWKAGARARWHRCKRHTLGVAYSSPPSAETAASKRWCRSSVHRSRDLLDASSLRRRCKKGVLAHVSRPPAAPHRPPRHRAHWGVTPRAAPRTQAGYAAEGQRGTIRTRRRSLLSLEPGHMPVNGIFCTGVHSRGPGECHAPEVEHRVRTTATALGTMCPCASRSGFGPAARWPGLERLSTIHRARLRFRRLLHPVPIRGVVSVHPVLACALPVHSVRPQEQSARR